jgi:GNAT superfamily N-acetyltransferase
MEVAGLRLLESQDLLDGSALEPRVLLKREEQLPLIHQQPEAVPRNVGYSSVNPSAVLGDELQLLNGDGGHVKRRAVVLGVGDLDHLVITEVADDGAFGAGGPGAGAFVLGDRLGEGDDVVLVDDFAGVAGHGSPTLPSSCDGGFAHNVDMLKFSLSSDALWRLPRHPDWKYEMVKGEAWLSSRPRPLHLCRPTSLAVGAVTLSGVEIRTLDARRDRAEIAELLMDVWIEEDPYRSFDDPDTLLQAEIERGLEDPGLGVVAVDEQGVCAVVLVGTDAAGDDAGAPMLMWLTVRREARERGLATALLRVVVEILSARGVEELASGTSAANVPSLRWHLTRGFQLAPDPIREAMRR